MTVAELMETKVQSVTVDERVIDAMITIADSHVYGVPVLDQPGGRLVGVLSSSDILEACVECGSGADRNVLLEKTTVAEHMTRNPITIGLDADVKDAAEIMLYKEVHRLFVIEEGRLVGVLSQSDVVRAVATSLV